MRKRFEKPSPALVISLIALFVALGGTGYAAATGSIDSREIKNSTIRGKDVKNSTLTGGDTKNNSLTGSDVAESKLGEVPSASNADSAGTANTATNASNLGGIAASAYTQRLYAVVDNPAGAGNATLARGSGATAATEATGVIVTFNRDVSTCAWTANKNDIGTTIVTPGWAQVALGSNPSTVDVRTRDDTGTLTDGDFHLVVTC